MSLNIKDPEAHRLAQQIARATGETMTRVVTEALRERWARLERRTRASVEELLAIAKRAARTSNAPTSTMPSSCTTSMACRDDRRHVRRVAILDCFAYALARATGEPLLFKGDDFALTDIRGA
jgi:antitoxin VapB